MAKKEKSPIPLKSLFLQEGFKRNFELFTQEFCRDKKLFDAIFDTLMQEAKISANFSNQQKEKAKKKRGIISDRGETIGDIFDKLATNSEYTSLSARELWPHLFSELENRDLDPQERDKSYLYTTPNGAEKHISFRRFENMVSKARGKSH